MDSEIEKLIKRSEHKINETYSIVKFMDLKIDMHKSLLEKLKEVKDLLRKRVDPAKIIKVIEGK